MAKSKTVYVCASCGYTAPRRTGQCPSCHAWNTMQEEIQEDLRLHKGGAASGSGVRAGTILDLATVKADSGRRWKTGIGEFDRVLGGGVVPGSVVLGGGEPGVGKSTLFLQVAGELLKHGPVLYVSGEESPGQIRMRADRLGIPAGVKVMAETEMGAIAAGIYEMKPRFLIVDSIQTIYDQNISSAPGSVTQVRACASDIARIAKKHSMPAFIIGHVTKEGTIAGPRVLEHLVDTVLYFEGERTTNLRVLRAVKNRFGGTDELGLFEMRETGMQQAEEPSFLLSARNDAAPLDGITVFPATQGTRPMLLEIQALCARTQLNNPRRLATGIDVNRLYMLCAVLEKKIGLRLYEQDVFVNVTGGIRVREYASDLAVAVSIVSSLRSRPVPQNMAFIAEVGLSGELRPVAQMGKRLNECARMGIDEAVVPLGTAQREKVPDGIKLIEAHTLFDAFERVL